MVLKDTGSFFSEIWVIRFDAELSASMRVSEAQGSRLRLRACFACLHEFVP